MKLVILFLIVGLVKTQDPTDSNDLSDSTDSNDLLDADSNDFSDSAASTEWSDSANSNDFSGSSDDDSGSSDEATGWRRRLAINAREQWTNRRNNVVRAWNNRQTRNLGQAGSRSQTGAYTIIRPGSSLLNTAMRGRGLRIVVRGQGNNKNTNRQTETNTNRQTQTNTIRPGRTSWRRASRNIATRLHRRDFRGRTLSSWNLPDIIRTTINRRPNWQSNTRFSSRRRQPSRQNFQQRTRNSSRNSSIRRRQSSRTSPFNARSRFGSRRRMTTGWSLFRRIVVRQTNPPYRLVYQYVPIQSHANRAFR